MQTGVAQATTGAAFLWQNVGSLKLKQQCLTLGAHVALQTGAGGAHTTGACPHFGLWHASALPTRTIDPKTPQRTKGVRCLIMDASPYSLFAPAVPEHPSIRPTGVISGKLRTFPQRRVNNPAVTFNLVDPRTRILPI